MGLAARGGVVSKDAGAEAGMGASAAAVGAMTAVGSQTGVEVGPAGTAGTADVGTAGMWLSSAGAETALQFEVCHSVIVQVVGSRHLLVFPPSEHSCLYPFSTGDGSPQCSRVDLSEWLKGTSAEVYRWPNVRHSFCLEATLHPGDVAYVPAGYWCHQTSLSASISCVHPFERSALEQRMQPQPWTHAQWGRLSEPIFNSDGQCRSLLLPSVDRPLLEKLLGGGVWPAAFVLGNELQTAPWRPVLRDARILELGAGLLGYPGLVAALCGSSRTSVTLTDKHPDLVRELARNVRSNGLGAQCRAAVYSWGEPAASAELLLDDGEGAGEAPRPFDVILAADCLYSDGTTGFFLDALEQLSDASTTILVSAEERWSLRECLEIAADRGWHFRKLGADRAATAAQLSYVDVKQHEMGEGRIYLYAVTCPAERRQARRAPPEEEEEEEEEGTEEEGTEPGAEAEEEATEAEATAAAGAAPEPSAHALVLWDAGPASAVNAESEAGVEEAEAGVEEAEAASAGPISAEPPAGLEGARDHAMLEYLKSESGSSGHRVCNANNLCQFWSGVDPFESSVRRL